MKYIAIEQTNSQIPIAETYRDVICLIRSDYFRYKGKKANILRMFLYALVTSNFGFCFWLRLSTIKGIFYPIARIMHRIYYLTYGLHITPDTKIGYGLYLSHGFGIFVNPDAIIGNNCNLSQCTTIGSNFRNRAAVIGDNVYIAPNVSIVDAVVIGSNVVIGAGSVVVKDVTENVTFAGNPAKEISKNNSIQLVTHRWLWCNDQIKEDR